MVTAAYSRIRLLDSCLLPCLIARIVGGEKDREKGEEIWCTSTDIYYAAHTRHRAGSIGSSSWIVTNSLGRSLDLFSFFLLFLPKHHPTSRKPARGPLFSGFFQSIELLSLALSSLPLDGKPFHKSRSIKSTRFTWQNSPRFFFHIHSE